MRDDGILGSKHLIVFVLIAFLLATTVAAVAIDGGWTLLNSQTDTGTTSTPSGLELVTSNGGQELSMLRGCVENEILKRNAVGSWACSSDVSTSATGAGVVILDLGDDGVNESSQLGEIAVTGDTNSIFTEPSADKLLIIVSNAWPTATALAANPTDCAASNFAIAIVASGNLTCAQVNFTDLAGSATDGQIPNNITIDLAALATALAANGANCSAGSAPLGVDASGASEGCFDVEEEAQIVTTAVTGNAVAHSLFLGTGASTATWTVAVPHCPDSGGNHINYNTGTKEFSCGTSGGSGSADTLQTAFDAGNTITIGAGVNKTLTITQNDTTNSPRAVSITNAGTGNAIFIDQNGNTGNTASSSGALFLNNTDNTGIGANFYSNAGAQTGAALVFIKQDNASADKPGLRIDHDGSAPALRVSATNTGSQASPIVQIDNDSSSGVGLRITHTDATNSQGLIRLDSPSPEIEYVETDQVAPAGKFETRVQADEFTINSRNAGDTAFENVIKIARAAVSGLTTFLYDILLDNQKELRWGEADANGSNYIAVKAPAAITSNITCTLQDDSTPFDSCITPSGAGTNSFETQSVPAGTSPVADSATDTLTWLAGTNIDITGDSGADSITISVTGSVATAAALAANGANCSAGNAPLGVDASGAAEGCFDVEEEAQIGSTNITGNAADDQLLLGSGANAATWAAIGGCFSGNQAVTYSATGNAFGCNTFLAGRSITFDTGVSTINADVELYTVKKSIVITSPATGVSNAAQFEYPLAATITEVSCSTDVGTVTIQLDERARATPNTAGTDVMTSTLVCDSNSETTTSFTNAGIAADVPVNLQILATASSPTVVRVHVKATMDD